MGKVRKGQKCSVSGCENASSHSVSYVEAKVLEEKGLKLLPLRNRVYLCDEHYKLFKKLRKKIEKYEKWRIRG